MASNDLLLAIALLVFIGWVIKNVIYIFITITLSKSITLGKPDGRGLAVSSARMMPISVFDEGYLPLSTISRPFEQQP